MKSIDKIIGKYLNEDFTPEAPGDMGSSDYDLMMQVIRAEEDTVYKYIALANQAKNPKVKKVLMDITQEERVHAHEMHILMKQLQSDIEKSA
jgi:rubrerythrin